MRINRAQIWTLHISYSAMMYRFVAFFTAAGFGLTPIANAWVAAKSNESAIWVTLCTSGLSLKLDIGQENDTPLPPAHTKACHAVCCKRGDDGRQSQNDKDDKAV